MSKASVAEYDSDADEEFDVDNMDFDLPAAPPVASSSRGPAPAVPVGQPMSAQQRALLSQFAGSDPSSSMHQMGNTKVISASELSKFKHYAQVYPIYIDAGRPHKNGQRRISKAKAVPYPKAQEIAEVCGRFLGLPPILEPEKTHPKDWQNPGRVRVLIVDKETGKPINKDVPDKYVLLNKVGEIIRYMRAQAKIDPLKAKEITSRLPYYSPAISYGTYAESLKGGGKMAQMMQGMMPGLAGPPAGSGPSEEEQKRIQEEKELAEKQRLAKMKALQKQGRRMVVRR